jgi:choline dehydrogenase-like flavoprotein
MTQSGDGTNSGSPDKFFTITSVLTSPFSRGSVTINSSDPSVPPSINPNFLAHPMDIHILKTALSSSIQFTAADAWKDYIVSPVGDFASNDEAKVEAYIRNSAGT